MREQLATQVAELLFNRQPEAIRKRLQESDVLKELGLVTYSGMKIGGASILLRHVLAAGRKIKAENPEVRLRGVQGGEARLSRSDDGYFVLSVEEDGQPINTQLGFLGLVSEDPRERLSAFERVVEKLGPTADISVFKAVVEERPLTDDELSSIVHNISHGVAVVQSRVRERLQSGRVTLSDLIPDSLSYFEEFCGPDPGDHQPEDYLTSVLPAYRAELLRRDLTKGLEICLLGALRDDLCPGPWMGGVDNDVLWNSLVDCKPRLDPTSLFAALDLALYRQDDERFKSFADDSVRILVADQFRDSHGHDAYQLIAILAKFVLNRINLMDGGALRPPFWKRMCAWMQAAFISRLLAVGSVDVDAYSQAVIRNIDISGEYANSIDLRREPMVEAGSTLPRMLRREVVGRLVSLESRHPLASGSIPRSNDIEQALSRLSATLPPWSWWLPGPLEGYKRPRDVGKILPEDLGPRLRELSGELLIANLENISQHVSLDEEMKEHLRDAFARNEDEDIEKRMTNILRLGTIAAAERDAGLAQIAADSVLLLASKLRGEHLIWAAVEALIRAAAAFEEEEAWAKWLEVQFLNLASGIQAGESAQILWHHIQALKMQTKLELGIFRRAEGAASAASF